MDLGGSPKRCPKCSSEMERGFLLDAEGWWVEWIGGEPEKSSWTGTVKRRGKVRYEVKIFRCKECGYLEHYAGGKG